MRVVTAKYIFDGINLLSDKAIAIDNKQIVDVIDYDQISSATKLEDFGDCVISPGLLDLQLNGCGGVLFNADISLNTLEIMHDTNLRFGTTGFLPTLITSPFDDVITALNVVNEWHNCYGNNRGVIGIHLEGPFISQEKRGIHHEEHIIKPTDAMLTQIAAYAKLFPIKITLAPEIVEACQIEYLVNQGVTVALGHSNASYEIAETGFKSGATAVTHIFNAMSGMTARNPGLIAAGLANPVYVGLIADMIHVDKANIQLLTKLKPANTYIVTDAVTPTATTITEFELAGKHLYVRDGKCVDENGTLGGACITMNQSIQNCIEKCGLSLSQALMMATLTPAQLIGLDNSIGKIAYGYRANLIAMDLASYACSII